MAAPFTIGIEEEYQMVDRQMGQLSPSIHCILEKGNSLFGDLIKAEMLQSMVEINSDIMADIPNRCLDPVLDAADDAVYRVGECLTSYDDNCAKWLFHQDR